MERFSIECRKTKTKVITLTNYNRRKQHKGPIRTRSKYMQPAPSAGKRVRPSHDWFWFNFSLVDQVARVLLTNHRAQESKTKAITLITFDTPMKTASIMTLKITVLLHLELGIVSVERLSTSFTANGKREISIYVFLKE